MMRSVRRAPPAREGGEPMPDPKPSSPARGSIEQLLQPKLVGASATHGLYSTRASFFVAFFGGPFAILFFAALNSRRLGRLGTDAPIFLLAGAGVAAFVIWASHALLADAVPSWLAVLGEGRRGVRNLARLLALLLFGLVYALHRRFHVATALHGGEAPSPWIPGIAATLAGTLVTFLVGALAGVVATPP